MKQLERTYVTEKQFRHKQSHKGAKFTHKIHKVAIDTSRARHDPLTYTMTHCTQLELNLYQLTYLDLGPPVPVGTLGDEVPPSGTVVGNHHGFFTVVGNAHHPKVLS